LATGRKLLDQSGKDDPQQAQTKKDECEAEASAPGLCRAEPNARLEVCLS
jgi:hypothetical protein